MSTGWSVRRQCDGQAFPGLGRVRTDTHHFSADLDTPLEQLEASDWIPFRKVLAGSKAQLMIGHVALTSVDPDRPASHSRLVVDGIVRKKWNYQGVVMTDDLVMGAIYQRNVCTAVVRRSTPASMCWSPSMGAVLSLFSCAVAASAGRRRHVGRQEVQLKGIPGANAIFDIVRCRSGLGSTTD
jgi:beta-N-acetylhexosaminidase